MNPVLTELISVSSSPSLPLSVCTLGPAETSTTPSLHSRPPHQASELAPCPHLRPHFPPSSVLFAVTSRLMPETEPYGRVRPRPAQLSASFKFTACGSFCRCGGTADNATVEGQLKAQAMRGDKEEKGRTQLQQEKMQLEILNYSLKEMNV
eukprot:superscaffoldBa00000945_g8126